MLKTYRITADRIREAIPEIRWLDLDKGQLEKPEDFHSLLVPAVLLGFGEIAWTGTGAGAQTGYCLLTVRLALQAAANTFHVINPEAEPVDEYLDSELLSARLHEAFRLMPWIGERRHSNSLFLAGYHVISQVYDCEIRYMPVQYGIPSPALEVIPNLCSPQQ